MSTLLFWISFVITVSIYLTWQTLLNCATFDTCAILNALNEKSGPPILSALRLFGYSCINQFAAALDAMYLKWVCTSKGARTVPEPYPNASSATDLIGQINWVYWHRRYCEHCEHRAYFGHTWEFMNKPWACLKLTNSIVSSSFEELLETLWRGFRRSAVGLLVAFNFYNLFH